MLAFRMDLTTAEEFYRRCAERKATTLEERTKILVELAQEGKINSVIETKRTPDQYVKDLAKKFGTVLQIKPKGDSDESRS